MKVAILILCLFLNAVTNSEGSTPLCLLCPCNSPPNEAPNINCANSKVPYIFENKFWVNDLNQSYPIQSLVYTNNNLRNLSTKFPTSNMTYLDLSNNFIKDIGNGVFTGLQKMEKLILSNNVIDYIHPDAFRGGYDKGEYFPLKSLRTLDLSYNKIHSLNDDIFEHIDELENLILSNNPLRSIDSQTLSAIASLVYLKELHLGYTQLQTLPENFMHTPRSLKSLDLSGNNFTMIPKTLEESRALEMLYFNDNPLKYLAISNTFPKIPTLKILHISHMPLLERVCQYALSELKNLEELHMNYNEKLSLINPKAFVSVSYDEESHIPLKKVFINNNNLTHLEKNTLNAKHLQDLNIAANPWSCDCENQWLVDEIFPVYFRSDETASKQLRCAVPNDMKIFTMYEVYQQNKPLRCLRFYENLPTDDAWLLIGTLSGVLVGVAFATFLVYIHRIKILNLGNFNYPAYSRITIHSDNYI